MNKYTMKVPDVGEGVVEVEIVEWLVADGDPVTEDQHIVDVMTDKATVEITSPVSGSVIKVSGEPGDMLAVGSEMIVIDSVASTTITDEAKQPTASISAAKSTPEPRIELEIESDPVTTTAPSDTSKSLDTVTVHAEASTQEPSSTSRSEQPSLVLAAPAVRRHAREAHIDLSLVTGTGRGGRISHEDLDAFIESGNSSQSGHGQNKRLGTQQIKVIGLRRMIAEKMSLSARSIPHFSYMEEVDVTELESLRQYMNANRLESQPKLTYMPFFMFALGRLMADFPQCNAHFDDSAGVITRFEAVHIGVATQTADGLMVPVVKHAESMSLWQLATAAKDASDAAKNNTFSRDDVTGSSITITSLGALGGLASTPVINHPEVAIIGVNKSQLRPMIVDGQMVSRLMMNLSSSFDHRVVDGYDAALFIQNLKGMLEHPATIFI